MNNAGAVIYSSFEPSDPFQKTRIFDKNGNVLVKPGDVIGGHTIIAIQRYGPVSINDSGVYAFVATYDGPGLEGIFTQNGLVVPNAIPTALNINNNGVIAWGVDHKLYTSEAGLVVASADYTFGRFFNDLGSLTYTVNGNVMLATVSGVPEPGTIAFMGLGLMAIGWQRPRSIK